MVENYPNMPLAFVMEGDMNQASTSQLNHIERLLRTLRYDHLYFLTIVLLFAAHSEVDQGDCGHIPNLQSQL